MDGMQPIMAETYTTDADATNYWAVAVVRKNNPSVTINNLYGRFGLRFYVIVLLFFSIQLLTFRLISIILFHF